MIFWNYFWINRELSLCDYFVILVGFLGIIWDRMHGVHLDLLDYDYLLYLGPRLEVNFRQVCDQDYTPVWLEVLILYNIVNCYLINWQALILQTIFNNSVKIQIQIVNDLVKSSKLTWVSDLFIKVNTTSIQLAVVKGVVFNCIIDYWFGIFVAVVSSGVFFLCISVFSLRLRFFSKRRNAAENISILIFTIHCFL